MNRGEIVEAGGQPYSAANDYSVTRAEPALNRRWSITSGRALDHVLGEGHGYLARPGLQFVTTPTEMDMRSKAIVLGYDLSQMVKTTCLLHFPSNMVLGISTPASKDMIDEVEGYGRLMNGAIYAPDNMKPGNINPFMQNPALGYDRIIFDRQEIEKARQIDLRSDFSIEPNEKLPALQVSVQLNYALAFDILRSEFGSRVEAREIKYFTPYRGKRRKRR